MRNALKTSFQGVSFNLSYPHARAGLPASAPKDRPALACGSALHESFMGLPGGPSAEPRMTELSAQFSSCVALGLEGKALWSAETE